MSAKANRKKPFYTGDHVQLSDGRTGWLNSTDDNDNWVVFLDVDDWRVPRVDAHADTLTLI